MLNKKVLRNKDNLAYAMLTVMQRMWNC